jgi:uncharacterized membrane protein YiaA
MVEFGIVIYLKNIWNAKRNIHLKNSYFKVLETVTVGGNVNVQVSCQQNGVLYITVNL